jgi:hypothetical protein
MKSMHRILLVASLVALTSSCATVPRAPQNHDVASIRTQYFADYPDGTYNDQIRNSELVKGMNVLEVLASWGIPERRCCTKSNGVESWTYESRDPMSQDFIIYNLAFEKRILTGWTMDRGTAATGGVRTESGIPPSDRELASGSSRTHVFGGATGSARKHP